MVCTVSTVAGSKTKVNKVSLVFSDSLNFYSNKKEKKRKEKK